MIRERVVKVTGTCFGPQIVPIAKTVNGNADIIMKLIKTVNRLESEVEELKRLAK